VTALALPAMLTVALPVTLAVAGSAASAAIAVTVRLTGSLPGATRSLATEARGLPGRRSLRARSSPTTARRTMAVSISFEAAAASSARLTNGEVGILPVLWRLPLGARQRRTNQATMHGAILVRGRRDGFLLHGFASVHGFNRFDRDRFRCSNFGDDGSVDELIDVHIVVMRSIEALNRQWRGGARLGTTGSDFRHEDPGFLFAPRGHTCLFVLMIRIARRASRLPDLILYHRDDRVIGNAALARTVVVQNVTEPKPALLH
jgi:hypothetical protein